MSLRIFIAGLTLGLVAMACESGSGSGGTGRPPEPPEVCTAGERPVEPAEGPHAFLLCGEPFSEPVYPAPATWLADPPTLEGVIRGIVAGTPDRAAELGLWTGFDLLTAQEQRGLEVDVELVDTGRGDVAEVRITGPDGQGWTPPERLIERPSDVSIFEDGIAATAFSFDEVDFVSLPFCFEMFAPDAPEVSEAGMCDPFDREIFQIRHGVTRDIPPSLDCTLVEYWTRPECEPGPP